MPIKAHPSGRIAERGIPRTAGRCKVTVPTGRSCAVRNARSSFNSFLCEITGLNPLPTQSRRTPLDGSAQRGVRGIRGSRPEPREQGHGPAFCRLLRAASSCTRLNESVLCGSAQNSRRKLKASSTPPRGMKRQRGQPCAYPAARKYPRRSSLAHLSLGAGCEQKWRG